MANYTKFHKSGLRKNDRKAYNCIYPCNLRFDRSILIHLNLTKIRNQGTSYINSQNTI